MAELSDIIRFEVCRLSKRIRDLKHDCLKTETARKWGFVKDGKPALGAESLHWEERQKQDIHWAEYEYERAAEYINPSHQRWGEYVGLKREVSVWLTARLIQKKFGSQLPESLSGEKDLSRHGISPNEALRRLQKTAKRLAERPGSFYYVDTWLALRQVTNA